MSYDRRPMHKCKYCCETFVTCVTGVLDVVIFKCGVSSMMMVHAWLQAGGCSLSLPLLLNRNLSNTCQKMVLHAYPTQNHQTLALQRLTRFLFSHATHIFVSSEQTRVHTSNERVCVAFAFSFARCGGVRGCVAGAHSRQRGHRHAWPGSTISSCIRAHTHTHTCTTEYMWNDMLNGRGQWNNGNHIYFSVHTTIYILFIHTLTHTHILLTVTTVISLCECVSCTSLSI